MTSSGSVMPRFMKLRAPNRVMKRSTAVRSSWWYEMKHLRRMAGRAMRTGRAVLTELPLPQGTRARADRDRRRRGKGVAAGYAKLVRLGGGQAGLPGSDHEPAQEPAYRL